MYFSCHFNFCRVILFKNSGAWSWQANAGGENADDFDTQARGTKQLMGRNEEGGEIDFHFDSKRKL